MNSHSSQKHDEENIGNDKKAKLETPKNGFVDKLSEHSELNSSSITCSLYFEKLYPAQRGFISIKWKKYINFDQTLICKKLSYL